MQKQKKYYGITVDSIGSNEFKFIWAFKIDKAKAHREGYDSKQVHGSIELDDNYPGCPYCKDIGLGIEETINDVEKLERSEQ